MSKLVRMKISGIRSFGCEDGDEQDVKFSCPVTLFLGQNGCGKTTIIEALKYAITGDLPSGTKSGQGFIYDPQMAKKCETRGQVKLKLYDINGQSLTVTKIATVKQLREKLTYSLVDSTISRGGEPISNRCIDVHREVCSSLGVPKSILNYVIFCHQEESHWPMEEPKKLKERFDAIFDSAKYNKCIENILKIKKSRSEEIRTMAVKLDYAKNVKTQMEKKRDQLQMKESRLSELVDSLKELEQTVEPLESELQEVYKLEKDITQLESKRDLIKTQLEYNNKQQSEILLNITELECSDDELEQKISSFEADLQSTRNEIVNFEDKKKDIERKENEIRKAVSKDQLKLGQLQAEEKEHNKKINLRTKLIEEYCKNNKLSIDSTDPADAIKELKKFMCTYESELKDFEKQSDEKEKKLQDDIDSYRTKYVQIKENIESKLKLKVDFNSELEAVTGKLNEMDTFDGQLQNIEARLARTENDLAQTDSQINVNDLESEIAAEKNACNNLEEKLQKVDNEIQIMQTYCSIQTELDLQKESLMKKENDLQKLNLKHKNTLEHIFEAKIPESNLKTPLENYLRKQVQQINDVTKKIDGKQKEIAKAEAYLNVRKEKLENLKTEIQNDTPVIGKYFGDQEFESKLAETKALIDRHQKKKSLCSTSQYLYKNFIDSLQKVNSTCPICSTKLNDKEQVKNVITDLKKKIEDLPNSEKLAEKELLVAQERHNKICELKSVFFKLRKMESVEVPAITEQIAKLEEELKKPTQELECLKTSLEELQKNQRIVNNVIGDAALIDQLYIEIKKIKAEISSLSSRMSDNDSTRSMQDALYEQENLRSSIKSKRLNLDTLNNKLSKHNKRLQMLKDLRNDLKTKELNIKKDLQGKDQLEIKKTEMEDKILSLEMELIEAEKEKKPIKEKLDESIQNKNKSKSEDNKKKEQMRTELNKLKRKLDEIIKLDEDIKDFIEKNVLNRISLINQSLEKYNKDLNDCAKQKIDTTKEIEDLKDQIINRKNYYRELQDNVTLRKKRKEAKDLIEKLKEYDTKLGNHNIMSLQREKRKLQDKLYDMNNEIQKAKGQKSEITKAIKEASNELAEPMYANAVTNYKSIFLEYKILEQVIVELNTFVKAVDWAMLQYHKQQMVYINDTIRELWRAIYRGNDIDYIEIKTDMDTSKSKEKRRVYQYRLVQVKNDVQLEMRGRCSAGQKVLASLIIRIALADTFSSKCGILALDEPTTNLDRENIASLCEALCDLVARKRHQKNFQLLIITHDQEFLEKLSRTILIENYYQVTRNESGKSTLTLKSASF